MNRLEQTFSRLREEGGCGLFPYLLAGYPDLATSHDLVCAALDAGADGFEIGMPFSDPMADGATLQHANARALECGTTLDTALDLADFVRRRASQKPILLMSYFNPIRQRGEQRFAAGLERVQADGVIVPDLPPEEATGLREALRARGLALVPMLAPTSPMERIRAVAALAPAFIYCVALVGVTGARQDLSTRLDQFLGRIRGETDAPLVVGFGISQTEHIAHVARLGANGAIVASALADLLERSPEPVAAARRYLHEMKVAAA